MEKGSSYALERNVKALSDQCFKLTLKFSGFGTKGKVTVHGAACFSGRVCSIPLQTALKVFTGGLGISGIGLCSGEFLSAPCCRFAAANP